MTLEQSQIANFFKNQTVFITGGTGILGKLIIEKLLRTCWGINKIYVLIRAKKDKTPDQRFAELLENPCFDHLKKINWKEKVFLVSGDCESPFLGLSPEDAGVLKNETTCVLHLAADVRFDKDLKELKHNVKATREMVRMAKLMPKLKVFLYVSTAYSNCIHRHVKEDFYEPPMKASTFLDFIENVDDKVAKNITPHLLLGKWPNAYTYTKSIAEDVVKNETKGIPTAIVRPSVVTSTFDEPMKGWFDTTYGVIGVILAAVLGVATSYCSKNNQKIHIVPADFVCNCILAAAWKTSQGKSDGPKIYNCVGEGVTCGDINKYIDEFYWDFPSEKYIWYKVFKPKGNKFWHDLRVALNSLPFFIIDIFFFLSGKPASAVRKYYQVKEGLDMMSFFNTKDFVFDDDNVKELWNEMSDRDKKMFKFYVKIADFREYFRNCALGIRLYLLNDPIETVFRGRRKVKLLFILHYVLCFSVVYFLYMFGAFVLRDSWQHVEKIFFE